jgi:iron only hydrogenase large subunit-like protein
MRRAPTMQQLHSVRIEAERCGGCMSCMRACPAAAIRVRGGLAAILADRCLDCGECIKICSRRALLPRTDSIADLSRFERRVAIPSPALYAQFEADVSLGAILSGLRHCGFDAVESFSAACDAVTAATEAFLADYRGMRPVISSFCPTVVRLIQARYPDLLEQLLPILPPREISARHAKSRIARVQGIDADRIGAIYVTPCSAKMVSIAAHQDTGQSYLDGAISISDLYPSLAAAMARAQSTSEEDEASESATALRWAFLGGFPKSLPAEHTLSVAGVTNVIRILDDIEKGRLRRYAFVECHACPLGCVSGCLTVENPYVARAKTIRRMQLLEKRSQAPRSLVPIDYGDRRFRQQLPLEALPPRRLDEDISHAIQRMKKCDQILARLPGIDCGACGAPSCQAFAEDVVLGEAESTACTFLCFQELSERVAQLAGLTKAWMPAKGAQS